MRSAVLVAGLAATVAGAQETRPVAPKKADVEWNHEADFSRYKTYAWVPYQQPVQNAANHVRITRAVERELEAKGFTKAEPALEADVFVEYQAKLEKQVRGTPYEGGAAWTPTNQRFMVRFDKVEVGSLIVQLWDGKTKDIVWQAKSSELITTPDQAERVINAVATRLFEAYPPKPEPAK
jgi:hypothetical protein